MFTEYKWSVKSKDGQPMEIKVSFEHGVKCCGSNPGLVTVNDQPVKRWEQGGMTTDVLHINGTSNPGCIDGCCGCPTGFCGCRAGACCDSEHNWFVEGGRTFEIVSMNEVACCEPPTGLLRLWCCRYRAAAGPTLVS